MPRYMHREKFFAEHHAEDMPHIADVLRDRRPSVIVELGTQLGGLTAFFADVVAPWGAAVHTFDIKQQFDESLLMTFPNIVFHDSDVLTRENAEVLKLIAMPRAAIYCDNGHKETELSLYAPRLVAGGLLGCHDYGIDVRPTFIEPLLAGLGFVKHRHAEFEALVTPTYPISMTRFWIRERA